MHLLHVSLAPALDIRVTRISGALGTGNADKLAYLHYNTCTYYCSVRESR